MPTFNLQLPDGQTVAFRGDEPPSPEVVKKIMARTLPRYGNTSADKSVNKIAFGDEDEELVRNFMKSAKDGDSVKTKAFGSIIKSGDAFVVPGLEAQKRLGPAPTPTESFVRAMGYEMPSVAAGLAASGAVMRAPIPNPYIKGGAALLSGGAAAIGERLLQDKLAEEIAPSVAEKIRRDYATNPNAVILGRLASSFPFFRPGPISAPLKEQAINRGLGAVIGGGSQAAAEISNAPEGEFMAEGGLGRITLAAGGEALLSDPTKLGRRMLGQEIPRALPRQPEVPEPSLVSRIDNSMNAGSAEATSANANKVAMGQDIEAPAGRMPEPASTDIAETLVRPREEVIREQPVRVSADDDDGIERILAAMAEGRAPIADVKTANQSASVFQAAMDNTAIARARNAEEYKINAAQKGFNEALGVLTGGPRVKASETKLAEGLVNYAGAQSPATKLKDMLGERVSYEGYYGRLAQDDTGQVVLVRDIRQKGEPMEVIINGAKDLEANPSDFGVSLSPAKASKGQRAGFIDPTAMQQLASPAAGAVAGYQFGDTPEERRRNAMIGALIGAGAMNAKNAAKLMERTSNSFSNYLWDNASKIPGGKFLTKAMIPADPEKFTGLRQNVEYIGDMEGVGGKKLSLYNLTEDIVSESGKVPHPAGSTVTADTLRKYGIKVPVAEAAKPSRPAYEYSQIAPESDLMEGARYWLLNIDDAVRSANPRIFGRLMKYEQDMGRVRESWLNPVSNISANVRSLITNADDFSAFNRAVMNGNKDAALAVAAKYGDEAVAKINDAYNAVRSMLDQAYTVSKQLGRDFNYTQEYFPRRLKSYKKFRKSIGKREAGVFDSAIAERERNIGRPLEPDEIVAVIKNALSSQARGESTSNLKARRISEITEKLEDQYEPFDVALQLYVNRMARDSVNRNWFGKAEANDAGIEGNFGQVIAEEIASGRLTPENQKVVRENLQARKAANSLATSGMIRIANAIRQVTSLAYLGQLDTGVAQLGDAIMAVQNSGVKAGLAGVGKRITDVPKNFAKRFGQDAKRSSLALEDIYASLDSDEITQFSQINKGLLGRAAETVLRKTVGSFDKFGKESILNAAWNRFQTIAKSPKSSRSYRSLESKYRDIFPEDFDQMIDELAKRQLTDRTRLLLFTELAGMQPMAPSSMPQAYARHPGGRLVYTLKSYWLKQINRMRREGIEKLRNPATRLEGAAFLTQYIGFMMAQGFAIDYIRDAMLGRKTEPEEYALSNFMRLFGLSKYQLAQVGREGPMKAMAAWFLPVGELATDFVQDVQETYSLLSDNAPNDYEEYYKKLRLPAYIPFVGRLLYNRGMPEVVPAGRGAEVEKKRRFEEYKGKSGGSTKEMLMRVVDPSYESRD